MMVEPIDTSKLGPISSAQGVMPKVGDPVEKAKGFKFCGFIVAVFQNRAGAWRVVVEHEYETGMLHIYSPEQLVPRIVHTSGYLDMRP